MSTEDAVTHRFNPEDPTHAAETYAVIGWLFSCTCDPTAPRMEAPEGLEPIAELGHTPGLGWRYDVALRRVWEECSPMLREWLTEYLFPRCDDHMRQCLLGLRRSR